MKRTVCLICNSSSLIPVIDLGMHPFADTFIGKAQYGDSEPVHPLTCDLCEECGHLQTGYKTDPIDRYTKYEYSYTSSNSSYAMEHWNDFFNDIKQVVTLAAGSLVVEVGSNDGYLGELFTKDGSQFIGIDASPFMADLAEKRGVQTIVGVLDARIVDNICNNHKKAKLVIANNVLNHADHLTDFISDIYNLLLDDGFFVFEVPYWLKDFENNLFDKIYHEHVNYFSVHTLKKLLENNGFSILNIQELDYHGGSIRVISTKKSGEHVLIKSNPVISNYIEHEKGVGIFSSESYYSFMVDIHVRRNNILKKIYELKSNNSPVVAIGAAARGNTLLNFYNMDSTVIDYVTDLSQYKIGKFTPLTRIPIVGDDIFKDYDTVYALFLTDNIPDNLKSILLKINNKIQFIDVSG